MQFSGIVGKGEQRGLWGRCGALLTSYSWLSNMKVKERLVEKVSKRESTQARGETEWREWREGEREACIRREVSAKKNKGSEFRELNTAELSLRTEMDGASEERQARADQNKTSAGSPVHLVRLKSW